MGPWQTMARTESHIHNRIIVFVLVDGVCRVCDCDFNFDCIFFRLQYSHYIHLRINRNATFCVFRVPVCSMFIVRVNSYVSVMLFFFFFFLSIVAAAVRTRSFTRYHQNTTVSYLFSLPRSFPIYSNTYTYSLFFYAMVLYVVE